MSVYKSKRSESPIEFIKVAQNLVTYTIAQNKKFPKSYRFTLTLDLYKEAMNIFTNSIKANSIYIYDKMTEEDFKKRHDYLIEAKASTVTLAALLTIVFDFMIQGNNFLGDKDKMVNMFKEWSRLTTMENKLLKGVIDSDKRRWREYNKNKK